MLPASKRCETQEDATGKMLQAWRQCVEVERDDRESVVQREAMTNRIRIIMPQFEREPGAPHPASPPEDWNALREMDAVALQELGCRQWNEPSDPGWDGYVLFLFPGEWYYHIPAVFPITTISGDEKDFVPEETSDDIRFGCLAYGICVKSRMT